MVPGLGPQLGMEQRIEHELRQEQEPRIRQDILPPWDFGFLNGSKESLEKLLKEDPQVDQDNRLKYLISGGWAIEMITGIPREHHDLDAITLTEVPLTYRVDEQIPESYFGIFSISGEEIFNNYTQRVDWEGKNVYVPTNEFLFLSKIAGFMREPRDKDIEDMKAISSAYNDPAEFERLLGHIPGLNENFPKNDLLYKHISENEFEGDAYKLCGIHLGEIVQNFREDPELAEKQARQFNKTLSRVYEDGLKNSIPLDDVPLEKVLEYWRDDKLEGFWVKENEQPIFRLIYTPKNEGMHDILSLESELEEELGEKVTVSPRENGVYKANTDRGSTLVTKEERDEKLFENIGEDYVNDSHYYIGSSLNEGAIFDEKIQKILTTDYHLPLNLWSAYEKMVDKRDFANCKILESLNNEMFEGVKYLCYKQKLKNFNFDFAKEIQEELNIDPSKAENGVKDVYRGMLEDRVKPENIEYFKNNMTHVDFEEIEYGLAENAFSEPKRDNIERILYLMNVQPDIRKRFSEYAGDFFRSNIEELKRMTSESGSFSVKEHFNSLDNHFNSLLMFEEAFQISREETEDKKREFHEFIYGLFNEIQRPLPKNAAYKDIEKSWVHDFLMKSTVQFSDVLNEETIEDMLAYKRFRGLPFGVRYEIFESLPDEIARKYSENFMEEHIEMKDYDCIDFTGERFGFSQEDFERLFIKDPTKWDYKLINRMGIHPNEETKEAAERFLAHQYFNERFTKTVKRETSEIEEKFDCDQDNIAEHLKDYFIEALKPIAFGDYDRKVKSIDRNDNLDYSGGFFIDETMRHFANIPDEDSCMKVAELVHRYDKDPEEVRDRFNTDNTPKDVYLNAFYNNYLNSPGKPHNAEKMRDLMVMGDLDPDEVKEMAYNEITRRIEEGEQINSAKNLYQRLQRDGLIDTSDFKDYVRNEYFEGSEGRFREKLSKHFGFE